MESAFAGRGAELDRVLASSSAGTTTLVLGEAGIGKSRLLREASRRLAEGGTVVRWAACLPLARQLPLLPVVELLRTLHHDDRGAAIEAVLGGLAPYVRADVARVLPELADAVPTGPSEGWEQERLFAALASLLGALADRRRLVLAVEDLHWADEATRDLLTYLLSRGDGPPLLLSARSAEPVEDEAVREWLFRSALASGVTTVRLGPLSREDVGRLATDAVGTAAAPAVVGELWRRGEGNPFFTEQLLAAGSREPGSVGVVGMLDPELAQLLRSRARSQEPVPRRVLDLLSVASRPLTEAELHVGIAMGREEVRAALRQLIAAQLVQHDTTAGYAPRHALLGEAVESALLPDELAELHAQIAGLLVDRGDPSLAAETATHWAAAGRAADELAARIAAAERSEQLYAFPDAAEHWSRAVELAAALADDRARVGPLALNGMRAWDSAGALARGAQLGEQGLAVARALGDDAVSAALLTELAWVHSTTDRVRGIREMLDAVRAFDGLPPSAEYAKALLLTQRILFWEGRRTEGQPYLHRAIAMAEALPDAVGVLSRSLTSLASVHFDAGDVEGGLATLRRAEACISSAPDGLSTCWVAVTLTDALLRLDRLAEAVDVGRRYLERIQAAGFGGAYHCGVLVFNIAEALLALGRVDEAGRLVDPRTSGPLRRDAWPLHEMRARTDLTRGHCDAAEERLRDLRTLLPTGDALYDAGIGSTLAELGLWVGRPGEALVAARAATAGDVATGDALRADRPLVLAMRACADLAQDAAGHLATDEVAEARRAAAELVTLVESLAPDPFGEHPFAVAAPAERADWLAELRRCTGEATAADWARAAEAWEALGRPHRVAYDRWRQAQCLLQDGSRGTAAEALRAARASAEQHAPLSEEVATLAQLARIELLDAAPAAVHDRPTSDQYGLTPRERDVLGLLTQGRTNAQIGAVLYMSPKTASVHVTAILRKLGAANRVHAAAMAQRYGIAGS